MADGVGSTIDLPKLETLEKSSVRVANGAILELPGVTNLAHVTQLWSVNAGSKLSFAELRNYEGQENEPIDFQATYGGALEMSNLETLSVAGTMRAEFDGSVIDLPALKTLVGKGPNPLNVALERGARLRAPSLQSLTNAQIQVSQFDSWLETEALSEVENASIAVRYGAKGHFGTAATLTAKTFLLQASQPETNVELPSLESLVGAEERYATILASEGASIELPNLRSLQYSSLTARDPASRLVVGALATMDNGVIAAQGGDVQVDSVQIDARGGGFAVLGGRLELPLLQSFRDPTGSSALSVEEGAIDFGQQSVAFSGITIRKYFSAELHAERVELEPGSRLEGAGQMNSRVLNAGELSVFSGDVLTIAGDYEQRRNGMLQVSLSRTIAAGELVVEGAARLDGRLDLQFAFDRPLLGSEHTILRADRIEGTFASGGMVTDDQTMFAPLIRAQTVVVLAAVAGDANLDGHVDLDDFGSLKVNFGAGHGVAQGDFDGDGAVTLSDFGILKRNFGRQGPSFTAPATVVPEPNTLILLALGAFAVLGRTLTTRRWRSPRQY